MFNLKKAVSLAATGLALVGCLAFGASAISSSEATSKDAQISASAQGALTGNHEMVGGGKWWRGINGAGWASSDDMHRGQEHGA